MQIQVVDVDEYAQLAERILIRPVRYINAPRGTIWPSVDWHDESTYS